MLCLQARMSVSGTGRKTDIISFTTKVDMGCQLALAVVRVRWLQLVQISSSEKDADCGRQGNIGSGSQSALMPAGPSKKTGRPEKGAREESLAVRSEVRAAAVEETVYASKPPWPRQAISQPVIW